MNTVQVLLIAVFCLSLVKAQSCPQSVKIICDGIAAKSYWTLGWFTTCYVNVTINTQFSDSTITSVVDSDSETLTDPSIVKGIFLNGISDITRFRFIPAGFMIHFPNLIALNITDSNLISIIKENLQEFGSSLEVLDLSFNLLISIDADLFEYNSNIKYVGFNGNPLRYIEPAFFTNLLNLKSVENVNFNSVSCMSQQLIGVTLKQNQWVNGDCFDQSAKAETKLLIENEMCAVATTSESSTQTTTESTSEASTIQLASEPSTFESTNEVSSLAPPTNTETLTPATTESVTEASTASTAEIIRQIIVNSAKFVAAKIVGLAQEIRKSNENFVQLLKIEVIKRQNETTKVIAQVGKTISDGLQVPKQTFKKFFNGIRNIVILTPIQLFNIVG